LIKFDQTEAYGYTDYPLNGETWNNQYRSFARRDLVMLVSWATAYVECKAVNWGGGNGYPLGLGDMSEENGAIPGTAVGYPGHPQNTHTNGYDIDIAYYQSTGTDNYLKSVCEHYIGNVDQYHCVESPDILDLWRSALFIGALQSSNRTRVIGVDGQIGSLMEGALDVLCANGWVEPNACNNPKLAFEVEDNGLGWYKFHHHHLHLSLYGYSSSGFVDASGAECLREDCVDMTEAMEEMASIKVPGHIHPSLPPLPQAPLSTVP